MLLPIATICLLVVAYAGMVPGIHLMGLSGKPLACRHLPGRAVLLDPATRALPYLGAHGSPYNSVPPTSGPYSPWLIATGPYRHPIPPEIQVSLLRHGDILVQYPPSSSASVRAMLENAARWRPDRVVVAPNSGLHTGVALTAWQRIETLPAPDLAAIRRFISALAGRYSNSWPRGSSSCAPTTGPQ